MPKGFIYYLKIFTYCLVMSLPLILPYFNRGYFPTHDGEWAVVRLAEMYREVKDLQIPPRFSGYLNFEYGYPLFNFAYPMPYYLGLVPVIFKLGFVTSIKILFALSVVLSAFFMYVLSKSLWKNEWSGIFSSILYIYVPYRIVDLYVRGSLGESIAFVVFPVILLGAKKIYDSSSIRPIILTGIAYSFLILTHNIMAVLFGFFTFFIIVYSLLLKKFEFVKRLLLSLGISLGISAFFWIPALVEKNFLLLSKVPIADRALHFVNPLQLIVPKWGYGVPNEANGFGYQLGIPQILVVFLGIFTLFQVKSNINLKFLLFLVFVFSFLLFSPASLIWSHTPLLSEINYPWTVLGILMFIISLIAGFLARLGKFYVFIIFSLCIMSIIFNWQHARPSEYVDRGDEFYATNQATTTSSNELMPLWVKTYPARSASKKIDTLHGEIKNIKINSKEISFNVDMKDAGVININKIYYPGWKAYANGIETNIDYSNKYGVMDIKAEPEVQSVRLSFVETPIRLFSDILSILSLSVGLLLFGLNKIPALFKNEKI